LRKCKLLSWWNNYTPTCTEPHILLTNYEKSQLYNLYM
jgi:hypothetical protein